jgi:hypothetical protein
MASSSHCSERGSRRSSKFLSGEFDPTRIIVPSETFLEVSTPVQCKACWLRGTVRQCLGACVAGASRLAEPFSGGYRSDQMTTACDSVALRKAWLNPMDAAVRLRHEA